MEFLMVYLLPILILVGDFVISKNPKWQSNNILEVAWAAGKEIMAYFMAKHEAKKEEEK
jgi:hypothetical protein